MTLRLKLAVMAVALSIGCDRTPRQDAAAVTPPVDKAKAMLPRPDPFRMCYNADTRMLSLYDLAENEGRWMLVTPRNKSGEPVSVDHAFMSDVNLDAVAIFYTTPSGLTSPQVTLREIVTTHVATTGKE